MACQQSTENCFCPGTVPNNIGRLKTQAIEGELGLYMPTAYWTK